MLCFRSKYVLRRKNCLVCLIYNTTNSNLAVLISDNLPDGIKLTQTLLNMYRTFTKFSIIQEVFFENFNFIFIVDLLVFALLAEVYEVPVKHLWWEFIFGKSSIAYVSPGFKYALAYLNSVYVPIYFYLLYLLSGLLCESV